MYLLHTIVNLTLLGHVEIPRHAQNKSLRTSADGFEACGYNLQYFDVFQMCGFWLAGYKLLGPETIENLGKIHEILKILIKNLHLYKQANKNNNNKNNTSDHVQEK